MCPKHERPIEVPDELPGIVPREAAVRSLQMQVERLEDGRWTVRAPWLDGPVIAATWPDAYWLAVGAR
jgi:hypothetical protein